MEQTRSNGFTFPHGVTLAHPPLVEAWLELRWLTRPPIAMSADPGPGKPLETDVDPFFQFALGNFQRQVKEHYPVAVPLASSAAPLALTPHVVRVRFCQEADKWPLVQLGPGIATVNFTSPYSWTQFRAEVERLRAALVQAYEDAALEPQGIVLRYRNAFEYDPSNQDVMAFLRERLNINVVMSRYIPGPFYKAQSASDINLMFRYEMVRPVGAATVRLATGIKVGNDETEAPGPHVLVCDLEFESQAGVTPSFADSMQFGEWLEDAHAVLHEWFFGLIQGPLHDVYA